MNAYKMTNKEILLSLAKSMGLDKLQMLKLLFFGAINDYREILLLGTLLSFRGSSGPLKINKYKAKMHDEENNYMFMSL